MTNEQEKAREIAKLLTAFADRKQLEITTGDSVEDMNPMTIQRIVKYADNIHIKPKLKIVNLTQQDLIDRASSGKTMWVKKHVTSSLITCIRPDKVYVGERGIDYGMLRVEYTFLDKSPCYKEVECE